MVTEKKQSRNKREIASIIELSKQTQTYRRIVSTEIVCNVWRKQNGYRIRRRWHLICREYRSTSVFLFFSASLFIPKRNRRAVRFVTDESCSFPLDPFINRSFYDLFIKDSATAPTSAFSVCPYFFSPAPTERHTDGGRINGV